MLEEVYIYIPVYKGMYVDLRVGATDGLVSVSYKVHFSI